MRISSPPTTHSCFYGIDTPERDKLLASHYDVAEMAKFIGVDQPRLRLDRRALPRHGPAGARSASSPHYCDACFTGDYPIPLDDVLGVEDRQLSLLVESA